jgi:hypothetical protein
LQQVQVRLATASWFIYAHTRVAEPLVGLPEVVRGDEPESAQGGNKNSSTVKGNWSHALLLERPVMVCEHKTHKHTQKLLFRQVCRGLLLHDAAALLCRIHRDDFVANFRRFFKTTRSLKLHFWRTLTPRCPPHVLGRPLVRIPETSAQNPKWSEKKVKDFVDQRVRSFSHLRLSHWQSAHLQLLSSTLLP